jgi:hypothetical protein
VSAHDGMSIRARVLRDVGVAGRNLGYDAVQHRADCT